MNISVASLKSVIADREPGQDIGRQMVDEDQPQRQPAKQIEPQFALGAGGSEIAGDATGAAQRRARPHPRRRKRWSGNSIGNGRHLAPSGE